MNLYTSNRLEILSEKLAGVLETPLSSPLDEEIVVVQSKGMERWVSIELARHLGICANIRFPFPNAFVYEIFRKIIPDLLERSPFDPDIMTWMVMKLLPSCITKPGFENLRAYLGKPEGNLKRFQLSERIAGIFDQYLLFRPEMILQWETGKEDHWQAVLWRELVGASGKRHGAAFGKAFFKAIEDSQSGIKDLPARVSIFGLSALPLFHMEVFETIARFCQVNLFLMNPCKHYWGTILSAWEIQRTIGKESRPDITAEELHLEKGNSLLASMGTLGRDFFDLINDFNCDETQSFEEPGEGGLLSCLQSDILNLRDRHQGTDKKKVILKNDTSIRINSCHSPMREIEVLHDRLLDFFERDSSLIPKDILVMTPDIETYAPYINAVFDTPPDDSRRIPYSISDRSIRKESETIDTFLKILDLWGGRFGAPQVLGVLESRAVRERFDLSEADLDLIQRWIKETRVRWGIDGESRAELGLPDFQENTWKAGLDRLLLGYAMPGRSEKMFGAVLPYDNIEGREAAVLGKFLEFVRQLFDNVHSLGSSRTLDEWSNALTGIVEGFFAPDEDQVNEMQQLTRTLHALADTRELSGFAEKVDMKFIKWHLGHTLEREGFGLGFITGGVTFCAMLPMRSIPFKIICLLGMNDNAYPRQSKPLGFDLIARHPKRGDRSRRHDDRYLFLEAILSARDLLYISYVGQSIQDNSLVPPSVLVSELMDTIDQGFNIPAKEILDHIVVKHPLQAFSPEYFKGAKKDEKLFSYSEENYRAAQCMLAERKAPLPFISKGLTEPEEDWKTVDVAGLCRFFGNPTRFLLNRRLGIHLDEKGTILEETESFDIKGLEKYLLEEDLVERKFAGADLKELFPAIRASGQLPHGTIGECLFDRFSLGVEGFVRKTGPYMEKATLDPIDVDLAISGFRLIGRIDAIDPARLRQYRYATVKSKDLLKIWIHHLTLNAARVEGYTRVSMLAGLHPNTREPALWEYAPVEDSEEILLNLLEKYWLGLVRPLPFFPESSWVYAQRIIEKNESPEVALRNAIKNWTGSDFIRGESADTYYQLCFANNDPLDSEFQHIAEEVFGPLLAHQKEIGGTDGVME